jgi:hypothetical protein
MPSVVVSKVGFATRLPTKRSPRGGAFLRWLRGIAHLDSESMETIIGRAVEQAFAEFAKEMQRSRASAERRCANGERADST